MLVTSGQRRSDVQSSGKKRDTVIPSSTAVESLSDDYGGGRSPFGSALQRSKSYHLAPRGGRQPGWDDGNLCLEARGKI
jgi:hypothetical protein